MQEILIFSRNDDFRDRFSGIHFETLLRTYRKVLFPQVPALLVTCRMWGDLLFETCLLSESYYRFLVDTYWRKCRMWGELLSETCLLFESHVLTKGSHVGRITLREMSALRVIFWEAFLIDIAQ